MGQNGRLSHGNTLSLETPSNPGDLHCSMRNRLSFGTRESHKSHLSFTSPLSHGIPPIIWDTCHPMDPRLSLWTFLIPGDPFYLSGAILSHPSYGAPLSLGSRPNPVDPSYYMGSSICQETPPIPGDPLILWDSSLGQWAPLILRDPLISRDKISRCWGLIFSVTRKLYVPLLRAAIHQCHWLLLALARGCYCHFLGDDISPLYGLLMTAIKKLYWSLLIVVIVRF